MTQLSSREADEGATARLGARVKARRKTMGLTLQALSESSGVSRAALSKIERAEMSPTYEVLRKLASGLELALPALVMEGEPHGAGEVRLVRAGEGDTYANPLYRYERLSGGADDPHGAIHISTLVAGDIDDFPELHAHDTQDFIHVLSGRVGAWFEGREPIQLALGDSVSFDGRIRHAFADLARPQGSTRVLWVSRPR
ncbi:MAG: XRE family transcriptional regulator [Pseudomonadota bacterium]